MGHKRTDSNRTRMNPIRYPYLLTIAAAWRGWRVCHG